MLTAGMFVADRYEIIEKIGAGGMSDVYKARDHILGRFVAIKVLKQEFSEDVNFVTKFRTEAQSAAGLEHPNIVNIYDVGSEDGVHFIVMECVEGVTLKTYIEKKGRLSYKEAVSIAIQVGRGMEAAHAKHIIHRDIKPQNILISTEGKAKVTDFGIARAVSNNTISADVMGSVHYASPEQARNGFVDGKSDIYSLGIVMYEMVTGRVPFDGETTVAVAIQHLQEEMVAPSSYAPDLPISLEKIILKCTQKSPDRRYETISDLLIDLKKVLISPNEDFVTMIPPGGAQDKTRVIKPDEVSQIKEASRKKRFQKEEEEEEEEEEYDEEEEDEEDGEGFLNPKMEKAVTIAGIVAAVIIIAIIIYLIGNVLGIFKWGSSKSKKKEPETETTAVISDKKDTEEKVTMIDVKGLSFEDAKKQLNNLGLGIFQAGTQSSDEYEEGQVVSQDVEKGEKVKKNTTINVYISSGQGSISVPDVKGYDADSAEAKLKDNGFLCQKNYSFSDSVASGKVISQTPVSGSSAKKGDTITIEISQGQESIVVPNVEDQSQEAAVTKLKESGFVVAETTTEYSDTVKEGNVISQSIAAGKYVDPGTAINLVISLGTKTVKYSCKATITPPDSDEVNSADIILYDAEGEKLASWDDIDILEFPYVISHKDIEGSSSGKIKITWYLSDGSSSVQEQEVTFTKQ